MRQTCQQTRDELNLSFRSQRRCAGRMGDQTEFWRKADP